MSHQMGQRSPATECAGMVRPLVTPIADYFVEQDGRTMW
jgi:hypothetical protein